MKTLSFSILSGMLFLSGCFSQPVSRRIQSSVYASDFNSISHTYDKRPTSAEIQKRGGENILVLSMDAYGVQKKMVAFSGAHIAEYIAAINKFTSWASLASERKELITKEIAQVPAYSGLKVVFTFHSGQIGKHYLAITNGVPSLLGIIPTSEALVFEDSDLAGLKEMLLSLPREASDDSANLYK
jgi:hypothetical protein